MNGRSLPLVGLFALLFGCDAPQDAPQDAPPRESREARAEPSPRSSARPEEDPSRPAIVALGDSLTAGYGIGLDEAYPAVLQELMEREGYDYEVVNAGVSGDTSAGGVRRLDWVLEGRDVAALIVALGANDGLRGLPPSEMKKNLATIVEEARSREIPVLLTGFQPPDMPDLRDEYLRDFVAVYPELAEEHDVALMPFFLEDVAGVRELNQGDGKHPNAEGARVMAANVWEYLEPLLSRDRGDAAP